MGVKLYSSKSDMDIPYQGMFCMRRDIAMVADNVLGRHYAAMPNVNKADTDLYNMHTEILVSEYILFHGKSAGKIMNFLYASDCSGQVTYGCCQQLLKLLDADTPAAKQFKNTVYGYSGRRNPAEGSDFVRILHECADEKKPLRWR